MNHQGNEKWGQFACGEVISGECISKSGWYEVNTPFKIKVCQITVMILSLVQSIIYAIENSNIFYTEGFLGFLPGLPKGKVSVPFCRYHFGLYLTDVPFVPQHFTD